LAGPNKVRDLQVEKELWVLEVNEYFDGKVKSIRFESPTLPASVGVMA
jgi:hypothetical protein